MSNFNLISRVLTCWMKTQKMILKNGDFIFTRIPPPPLPPPAHANVTWETREQRKPLKREASWRGGGHWWGERRGDSWERGGGKEGATRERVELVFLSLLESHCGFCLILLWFSCKQNSWFTCTMEVMNPPIKVGIYFFHVVLKTDLNDKGRVSYLISVLAINLD